MLNIIFMTHERALQTGISLPMDMLAAADALRNRRQRQNAPLNCQVLTLASRSSATEEQLRPSMQAALMAADYIFLPPIWGNPMPVVRRHPWLGQLLATRHQQGGQLVATGTGVCWLAQQGLLDERLATTHWYYFQRFEQLFPRVKLQPKVFITHSHGLYCAGSINALSELFLHFIGQWFGPDIGRTIEAHFGHEISKSLEPPILTPEGRQHFDEAIADSQYFGLRHLHLPLQLQDLAKAANLAERTFKRRFKQATGQSPLAWLQQQRLKQARLLLKDSNLDIGEITERIGLQDASYFARRFKKDHGLSPSQYRVLVRAKMFSSE